MKVIIAGGRDFKPDWADLEILIKLDKQYFFIEIVSGKATGADTFGEQYAKLFDITVKEFPADWKNLDVTPCLIKENKYGKYNALAGNNRNTLMATYADAVILFPGGSGTADMRKLAIKHGLKILYDAKEIK